MKKEEKKEDKKQAKKHKDELKKDSYAVKRLKKTLASMDSSPKKKVKNVDKFCQRFGFLTKVFSFQFWHT